MVHRQHADNSQFIIHEAQLSSSKHGYLLRNMVLFGRLLRALELDVTPTQILDLVEGLKYVDIGRRDDFKDTAKTILVSRHEHIPLFDRAFDLFWQAREEDAPDQQDLDDSLQKPPQPEQELAPSKVDSDDSDSSQNDPEVEKVYTYSAREVLRQKDFADLTAEELTEVKYLMQDMLWELQKHRSRRKTRALRGSYLDLRRSIRRNMRHGGEFLELTWRRPKLKRRPLVVIADISGSMERYARVLLKFIYVISSGLEKTEAFVFGTRLTRITHQLKAQDIDTALDQSTAQIQDWGGGTRIGESLKTFNFEWGRRVLSHGAIVLIISDGWDRGDIDLLKREMDRLQLSCQRLIWLNPLLGSDNYKPLTRGIQAALPYVDDFLPVHNLQSLEQLGDLLVRLGEHRPLRRQHGLRTSPEV